MEVVDAFCGAGGFSAGAMAAGCSVTMGIDSDPVPLKLWAANMAIALSGPSPGAAADGRELWRAAAAWPV